MALNRKSSQPGTLTSPRIKHPEQSTADCRSAWFRAAVGERASLGALALAQRAVVGLSVFIFIRWIPLCNQRLHRPDACLLLPPHSLCADWRLSTAGWGYLRAEGLSIILVELSFIYGKFRLNDPAQSDSILATATPPTLHLLFCQTMGCSRPSWCLSRYLGSHHTPILRWSHWSLMWGRFGRPDGAGCAP